MRERKDFVQVRLSEAGRQFAGKGKTLRVATARLHYLFEGETPVEVLRAGEWPMLRKTTGFDGDPMFEEVAAGEADSSPSTSLGVRNDKQEGDDKQEGEVA